VSRLHFSFLGKDSAYGHKWRKGLAQWLDRREAPESARIMAAALVVGVGAGLGAVVFRWLIGAVDALAYGWLGEALSGIAPFHLLIIPALGGAIAGPIISRFAPETRGAGVPEVMEAVALRGGRIRPRVAALKPLAASICIGAGSSVGSEGPAVQIGSALGSTLGQIFHLSDEQVRTLVACGAAGGISAAFNAPIAGAIFALEVILGRFHAGYFGAVVISAVAADVVAHSFLGNLRTFTAPTHHLANSGELVFYALLGAAAGLISVGVVKLLALSGDWWDKSSLPDYAKPALGGLLLGVVGLLSFKLDGYPRVFGVGYETIGQSLSGQLALQVTIALLFIKIAATTISLSSGASGGIFAPALFMGAMLGDSFGQAIHYLFPSITGPSEAYALVGMAALVSGTTHTPVTSILIIFEMTGNYRLILPLMLAAVISSVISRLLSGDSVYTLKLSRRGIHLEGGQDIDVMQGVTVGEAMSSEMRAIPLDMSLEDLGNEFARSHKTAFSVVDESGDLLGVVSMQDLERAIAKGAIAGKRVADIATIEDLLVAYPHEPMWMALRRMGIRDVGRLPVVEREGSRRLVGVVRRSDIIRAYNHAMVKRARHQHKIETLRLGKLDGTEFVHIDIPSRSPVIGKRVSEIKLPEQCLIVSVQRDRKPYIAHGYTILQEGDQVTVFAEHSCVSRVRERLTGRMTIHRGPEDRPLRHREFTIPAGASCSGKRVRDLSLSENCILVSIRKGKGIIVPHGDTVLHAGDVVEVFGLEDDLEQAKVCLSE